MEIFNKEVKTSWIIMVVFLALAIFFSVFYFYGPKIKKEEVVAKTKEELIKEKIGAFSVKEESEYQGGVLIKATTQKGEATGRYTFFYKDNRLQRLPEEYIVNLADSQLSEAEKQNKTVSFKYQEEFNTNAQDAEGKDVIYRNVFMITKELPESEWGKSAMYEEPDKYQVILVNEHGQFLFKFLSNRIF